MLKQLKRMVGFFMKREISELVEKLESTDIVACNKQEMRQEVGSRRSEGFPTVDIIQSIPNP